MNSEEDPVIFENDTAQDILSIIDNYLTPEERKLFYTSYKIVKRDQNAEFKQFVEPGKIVNQIDILQKFD